MKIEIKTDFVIERIKFGSPVLGYVMKRGVLLFNSFSRGTKGRDYCLLSRDVKDRKEAAHCMIEDTTLLDRIEFSEIKEISEEEKKLIQRYAEFN